MNDLKLFFSIRQGTLIAVATNFVGKIDLPSPCSSHDIRKGGALLIEVFC